MHLGQNRAALRFDVVSAYPEPRHAIGFDTQQQVEVCLRHGRVIARLIDPGIAVPFPALSVNAADHIRIRKIFRLAERHVFDKMGESRLARQFVAGAHLVQHLYADHREVAVLEQDNDQAIAEFMNARIV